MKAKERDEDPRQGEKLLSHCLVMNISLQTVMTASLSTSLVGCLQLKFDHINVLTASWRHSLT